jgi:agmatinase
LPVNTTAVFFPFDLFGSAGAAAGADALYDAFEELLADNRREHVATRSRAYEGRVRVRRLAFEKMADYQNWRPRARQVVRRAWKDGDFLLWTAGNHLGVLPVYEELGCQARRPLVIQFDAHLDVQNFSDTTPQLSHGNFLLHSDEPLPTIINIGHRDLLLPPEHVRRTYRATFPAAELASNTDSVIRRLQRLCGPARTVFLDIDCDVFDPSCFPAVSHAVPFGLDPLLFLRVLDAVWSDRVIGVALSEFDPGRDQADRGLATAMWLLEYVLLKRYEKARSNAHNSTKLT